MYDGDMAGDDDDESLFDLRCLLLRTVNDDVTNDDAVNSNDVVVDDMSDVVVVMAA